MAQDDDSKTGDETRPESVSPDASDSAQAEAAPQSDEGSTAPAKTGSKLSRTWVLALSLLAVAVPAVIVSQLVLGFKFGEWAREKFGERPRPDGDERYSVALRGDEPQLGPDDALVTVIEFSDFQCPYCAQSVEPLKQAMDAYKGDVRLIFKHYPLPGHRAAGPAAHASWAAHQQGQFWVFHDRLFEAKAAIVDVPKWVQELGLDADKFDADMDSPGAKDAVGDDMLAGSKVGVVGTPAFFVNGHLYRGKRDKVGWKKIIEAELSYAKELVDDGVARGEVYAHLMKDALKEQVDVPSGRKKKRKRRAGEPDDESVYAVPAEGAPAMGPEDALVTIVEFADYHCPYCERVRAPLDRLLSEYPSDLRVVYRQMPLAMHPRAKDASRAALAARRQGKFWEMHNKLFDSKAQTIEQFTKLAQELGLDVEQFRSDYESPEVEAELLADMKLAKTFGVSGTPVFFINGRYLSGSQSYPTFAELVEARLAEAKQLVASGTPRAEVYRTIISAGKTSARD